MTAAAIILALALGAPPESPPETEFVSAPPAAPRSVVMPVQAPKRTLQEWREAVQQALKEQSSASETEQPAATLRLVTLYRELLVVEPLNSGEDKRLRMLVRARLLRIRDEIGQDLPVRVARIKTANDKAQHAKAAQEQGPVQAAKLQQDRAILAQWRGALGQFRGGQAQGGVAGGDAKDDDGPELVDLIQSVLSPDFWDANGGPGSIVYFQSLHILAVRATTEKHEQIADLLDALRRAGN